MITERQQPCENLASIDPKEERRVMAIKLPRLVLGGRDDPEGWTFVLEVMITNYQLIFVSWLKTKPSLVKTETPLFPLPPLPFSLPCSFTFPFLVSIWPNCEISREHVIKIEQKTG